MPPVPHPPSLSIASPVAEPAPPRIGARLVVCLGLSQLVGWGCMHYLIAVFGPLIGAELGWSAARVQAGFSLALLVMGASSVFAGRWIDAGGGRPALMTGCACGAAGCALLALSHSGWSYFAGWVLLGLGMRLALYDAAFATLAHLGGASAKRAMSQITLFGGLASTVFWPVGQALADALGWRGALGVYAALLALCALLHLAVPRPRHATADSQQPAQHTGEGMPLPATRVDTWLFGVVAVLVLFMQTGVAAHFLALLRGLGWDARTAVTLATLLGLGQLVGRAWMVAWGHRHDAVWLNLLPCVLLAAAHALALGVGGSLVGAGAFAFCYGAGNGIATITRGAMPLLLFDTARYGRIVGGVLRPAFALSAGAPVAVALALQHWGHAGTLAAGLVTSVVLVAAALGLALRHGRRLRTAQAHVGA